VGEPAVNPGWRKSSYSNGGSGGCVEVGVWRKSSHSNGGTGTCVEVGVWRKSSYSNGGTTGCVEVGAATTGVRVRDTTNRAGAVLFIPVAAWRALLAEIRA
jgi:Domain of unknown function (DUF397)